MCGPSGERKVLMVSMSENYFNLDSLKLSKWLFKSYREDVMGILYDKYNK
jgi:hypothetical protein